MGELVKYNNILGKTIKEYISNIMTTYVIESMRKKDQEIKVIATIIDQNKSDLEEIKDVIGLSNFNEAYNEMKRGLEQ